MYGKGDGRGTQVTPGPQVRPPPLTSLGPLLPVTVSSFLLFLPSSQASPLFPSLPFSKVAIRLFVHCVCTFVMLSQCRTLKKWKHYSGISNVFLQFERLLGLDIAEQRYWWSCTEVVWTIEHTNFCLGDFVMQWTFQWTLVNLYSSYTFASGSPDNIKQWKFPDGGFIQNLSGHNAIINTLAVNADGVLVSGGTQGFYGVLFALFWSRGASV